MQQSTRTRVLYALGYVVVAVLAAFCMADFAQDALRAITIGDDVCGDQPNCTLYGYLGVARLTFALSVYHFLLGLVTLGVHNSKNSRAKFHNSKWALKLLLLSTIVVGFWFIPNSFYVGWGYFALGAAFLFAIAQFFMLVGFSDSLNTYYLSRFNETEEVSYMFRLSAMTFLFSGLAVSLLVMLFVYFSGPGCGLEIFFTTFTLVFVIISSALSVTPFIQAHRPNIGLFQSVVIGAYASYMTWIAISGQTVDECNKFQNEHASRLIALIPGSIFLGIALVNWVFMDGKASESEYAALLSKPSPVNESPDASATGAPTTSAETTESVDENDDEQVGSVYPYSRFHFVLGLAAIYLAMIITSWNTLETYDPVADIPTLAVPPVYIVSSGMPAMCLKWIAGAISLLLYIYSLFAPILFPDRSFD